MENDKEDIIEKISEVYKKIDWNHFPRLVVCTDDKIFFYDKGECVQYFFFGKTDNFDWFPNSYAPERGIILSNCAQLELIVNEIISSFLEIPRFKMDKFITILDYIDFADRVRLLFKWKFISKEEKESLFKIKDVRNAFAHQIVPNYIEYKNGIIGDELIYNLFKEDYGKIVNILLLKLKEIQPPLNDILTKLKSFINLEK